MNNQVEFLIKLRDANQQMADAANELITSLAPPEVKAEITAVPETTFTTLEFEPQKGAKLGDFDVANKANNIEDKWTYAFNILRNANATIKDRYHSEDYQFSYWVLWRGQNLPSKTKAKTVNEAAYPDCADNN